MEREAESTARLCVIGPAAAVLLGTLGFASSPEAQTDVADGYWVMLSPLRVGTHTLHSKAVFTGGIFAGTVIEATTHLTVAP